MGQIQNFICVGACWISETLVTVVPFVNGTVAKIHLLLL